MHAEWNSSMNAVSDSSSHYSQQDDLDGAVSMCCPVTLALTIRYDTIVSLTWTVD